METIFEIHVVKQNIGREDSGNQRNKELEDGVFHFVPNAAEQPK